MFGFLIAGEVNDDAVKLKTFADIAISKYINLTRSDFEAAISKDFPSDRRYSDRHYISFRYPELREFLFSIDIPEQGELSHHLTAFGEGRYAGFMLQVNKAEWHCSVSNGISYNATGGAKKIAQIMENKFGVKNITRYLKRIRRAYAWFI
jgi:hypothetical protein